MFQYSCFSQAGTQVCFFSLNYFNLDSNFFCWARSVDWTFSSLLSKSRMRRAKRLTSLGQGASLSMKSSKLDIVINQFRLNNYYKLPIHDRLINLIYIYKMSDNNLNRRTPTPTPEPIPPPAQPQQPLLEQRLSQLHQALLEKNQIIRHLEARLRNQEKQIDLLVMDAEQKHFHEITKYYAKSYEKYMRNGRYLLLRIQEGKEGNVIYLPKGVRIVHFGELELMRGVGEGDRERNQGENMPTNANPNPNSSLKQLKLNKQQTNSFETSVKGLSAQIAELKQKLKTYTTMVTQKSASKMNTIAREKEAEEQGQGQGPEYSVSKFNKSQGTNSVGGTPQKMGEKIEKASRDRENESGQPRPISPSKAAQLPKLNISKLDKIANTDNSLDMPSPSPLKKKPNTRIIQVRKR